MKTTISAKPFTPPFRTQDTRRGSPTRQKGHATAMQRHPVTGFNPAFRSGAVLGRVSLTPLANESTSPEESLIGLANEIGAGSGGDGWAIIPYGEWPHEQGLQRFDRAAAEQMVGYFRNGWNTLKRAVVGLPIYSGHPDLADELRPLLKQATDPKQQAALRSRIAALEKRYTDPKEYGSIADMEARDDGLAIKPVLNPSGAALVNEKGLTKFSPHWIAKNLPPENGRQVFAPALLRSIGLTARPNISGTSLVNTQPQSTTMNKKLLLALLAALGRPLANEATDEQIDAALSEAATAAAALAQRPEQTALANEQTARTTAEGRVTELTTALANEQTALANARAAHAETLVNQAVASGRILENSKAVWLGRLKRDFATESTALANEETKLKTKPRDEHLGARKPTNGASEKFTALVNERVEKTQEPWTVAWQNIKGTTEGKALFEQMNAPATTSGAA